MIGLILTLQSTPPASVVNSSKAAQVVPVSAKQPQTAQVQIKVTEGGRFKSCVITKSTGDAELDRETCDIVKACMATGVPVKELGQCKWRSTPAKAEN